jgi:integrase
LLVAAPGYGDLEVGVAGAKAGFDSLDPAGGARRFLEFSFEYGDPMHAGYVLMLVLGLRRGELLGLRWDDIDLETGTAQIRSQLQRVDGRLVLRPTKTISSEAVLPLPEPCVHALAQHRLMVERWRADAGKAWHD